MAGLNLPSLFFRYLPITLPTPALILVLFSHLSLCDTSSELDLVVSKEYLLDLTTFTFTSPLWGCSSVCMWLVLQLV